MYKSKYGTIGSHFKSLGSDNKQYGLSKNCIFDVLVKVHTYRKLILYNYIFKWLLKIHELPIHFNTSGSFLCNSLGQYCTVKLLLSYEFNDLFCVDECCTPDDFASPAQ